jgi:putative PIN family toxin of toxin-antitoxin system
VRIVLDTNVLVSGLLNPHGPPGRIVDLFLEGTLTLLVDDRIADEYREVLRRPRFELEVTEVAAVLALIDMAGERVAAAPTSIALPDPDDRPFLEVARAGRADALVTGNPRHFAGAAELGVRVVSPAVFMTGWPS